MFYWRGRHRLCTDTEAKPGKTYDKSPRARKQSAVMMFNNMWCDRAGVALPSYTGGTEDRKQSTWYWMDYTKMTLSLTWMWATTTGVRMRNYKNLCAIKGPISSFWPHPQSPAYKTCCHVVSLASLILKTWSMVIKMGLDLFIVVKMDLCPLSPCRLRFYFMKVCSL